MSNIRFFIIYYQFIPLNVNNAFNNERLGK